jgi:hypothetical protein
MTAVLLGMNREDAQSLDTRCLKVLHLVPGAGVVHINVVHLSRLLELHPMVFTVLFLWVWSHSCLSKLTIFQHKALKRKIFRTVRLWWWTNYWKRSTRAIKNVKTSNAHTKCVQTDWVDTIVGLVFFTALAIIIAFFCKCCCFKKREEPVSAVWFVRVWSPSCLYNTV